MTNNCGNKIGLGATNHGTNSGYLLKIVCIVLFLTMSGCERTSSGTPRELLQNFANALGNRDQSALVACFDQTSEAGRVGAESMGVAVEVSLAVSEFTQSLKEKYPEAANDPKFNSFNSIEIENPYFAELIDGIDEVEITVEGDRAFGRIPINEDTAGKDVVIEMIKTDRGWLITSMGDDTAELNTLSNATKPFIKMFEKLSNVVNESSSLEEVGTQLQYIYMEAVMGMAVGKKALGKNIDANRDASDTYQTAATGNTVLDSTKSEPSILKVPVQKDLNREVVEESIVSELVAHNIKKLGMLPISELFEMVTGKPSRFLRIYLFGDLPLVEKLIEYNPAYSAYLPARIVLAGDKNNRLWIYSLDMTNKIQNDSALPVDVRTEAIEFYRNVQDIILSSAGAKNKSQLTVDSMPSDVSIFKKQAHRSLTSEDIEGVMRFAAHDNKLRNVGDIPVSDMLKDKHADPRHFLKIYMFDNIQTMKTLIEHNPGYSMFLPHSIAVVGDNKDMLWVYSIDLESVFQKDSELLGETRGEAMQLIENIKDVVSRGAEGNY